VIGWLLLVGVLIGIKYGDDIEDDMLAEVVTASDDDAPLTERRANERPMMVNRQKDSQAKISMAKIQKSYQE
jgi:hypothetical protein